MLSKMTNKKYRGYKFLYELVQVQTINIYNLNPLKKFDSLEDFFLICS